MRKNIIVFFLCGFLFLFFIFFSYLVDKDKLDKLDFDTTVRLQDNIPRRLDETFSFFSDFGTFEVATILLIIVLVIRRRLMGLFAFFFYGSFHILEIYGKIFVDHPPPPEFLLRTKHLVDFPQFHVRSEFSYPSGHSGRAAFISVLLAFFIMKSKKIHWTLKVILICTLALYDILMWTSRIYLGEHWLSDVMGGIILGCSFALISEIFIEFNYRKFFRKLFFTEKHSKLK